MVMYRGLATLALLGSFAAASAPAIAQQPMVTVVVLMSQDRALVRSKPVAAKDIISSLLSQQPKQPGPHLVNVQNCAGVSADAIQGLVKDLQKNRLVPVIDFNPPDARLCSR
jgi:hypothetical protein